MDPDKESLPPFVLALTIVRPAKTGANENNLEDEILYCVRDQQVNLTHPNVVSIPTQRIPTSLGEELMAKGTDKGTQGETQLLTSVIASNKDVNGHDPMIFAVESIMARKLGLADQLESDELAFTVELAGHQRGRARYLKGSGKNPGINDDEELRMINLFVRIDEGADLFPDKTPSYRILSWATMSNFTQMWEDKKATGLGITEHEAIFVCVDGLCLHSTYDILTAMRSQRCLGQRSVKD